MPAGNKYRLCFLALLCLLLPAARPAPPGPSGETAPSFYDQALARLAEGDSAAALELLDRALEADPKHGPALIERGRLYLGLGLPNKARWDFTLASGDGSPHLRSMARLGLGDIYSQMPNRSLQAVAEYRLSLKADPANRESYYALSQAGLAINTTSGFIGYRIASEALLSLICLDPCYRDAYTVWRDTILDKTDDELRKVCGCLGSFIAENPEKSPWLLDLAEYRYRLGEITEVMETLDRLEKACPEQRASGRLLLRARCCLELEDVDGFERSYREALEAAQKDGDFARLVLESEPIFNPAETKSAGECRSAEDWEVFFRKFWKRRDPDPLNESNERLVEHYRRLREAEKKYRVNNLYPSRFNSSRNYNRLVSLNRFVPRLPGEVGAGFQSQETGPYEYDPDLFLDRCRGLALNQRGLLYLRHGPPDKIIHPMQASMYAPTIMEVDYWWYGRAFFKFDSRIAGAGSDYLFIPEYEAGAGDIKKAMETESFRDWLPSCKQDYYAVDFMGRDGCSELEFYQSVPAAAVPDRTPPGATVALYDSTWAEIARASAASQMVASGTDSSWVAVNRVVVGPGRHFYALRLEIPGRRAVQRAGLDLSGYSRNRLDISGIFLGSPPLPECRVHSRGGVELLPRPSLTFTHGEKVMVYLEVYGLRQTSTSERSFQEKVTVTLDESKGVLDKLKVWEKKLRKSLTLTFDRTPLETAGPVAEHFELDTSDLVPGNYLLTVEVRDNSNGRKRKVAAFFKLSPAEKHRS